MSQAPNWLQRHGEPAHVFPANAAATGRATTDGWRDLRESDPRRRQRRRRFATEPQIPSDGTSTFILDQRGADIADSPGGASGLLVRDYKGKETDRVFVTLSVFTRKRSWKGPPLHYLWGTLRTNERQHCESAFIDASITYNA